MLLQLNSYHRKTGFLLRVQAQKLCKHIKKCDLIKATGQAKRGGRDVDKDEDEDEDEYEDEDEDEDETAFIKPLNK